MTKLSRSLINTMITHYKCSMQDPYEDVCIFKLLKRPYAYNMKIIMKNNRDAINQEKYYI